MKKSFLSVLLPAAMLFSAAAVADNDIDIPINGDFRGVPSGYSPAPGWILTAGGGSARILPTTDADDFMLELIATPAQPQSVVSDIYQLPGNVLKLELKVNGAGTAAFGYQLLDDTRTRVIAADQQAVQLTAYDQKIKRYFTLAAQARWIRITLTAGNGSTARFRDVDADISVGMMTAGQTVAAPAPAVAAPAPAVAAPAPAVAAPAPAVAAPAPAPAVAAPAVAAPAPAVAAPAVAAPAPAVAAPAPAVAAPAPAVAAPAATAATAAPTAAPASRLLQHDKYYMYTFLGPDEHFETSLPSGSDIDFELGEDASGSLYWRLISVDPSVCRVKLKHEQDGVFPFRIDKAEIELKALRPGRTDVVFVCGQKRLTVHFTAQ